VRWQKCGGLGHQLLLKVAQLVRVALLHGLHQLRAIGLVGLHLGVPHGVELLELHHVRLLDGEHLGELPRAQRRARTRTHTSVFAVRVCGVASAGRTCERVTESGAP
jgi:hypothetical protein